MKNIFDAAVNAEIFRGKALLKVLVAALDKEPKLQAAYKRLAVAWPKRSIGAETFLGIIRWSFLLELVKQPKIETTKFEVRWTDRLGQDDPRFAAYEECLKMSILLATEVAEAVDDPEKRTLIEAFAHHNLVPYELPIDYRRRKKTGRLHVASNVEWLWGGVPRKTVLLRDLLLGEEAGKHLKTFDVAYKSKIDVKTYLTDRVLTGAHKTNREKRWETHPASVHYALRRDCLEIEHELMQQLCRFDGFPKGIRDQLVAKKLINSTTDTFRCPITFEPLSFAKFEEEIHNPIAGKSTFQVGHLNPLKAVNDDPRSGHTAKNISWVSANGNRIQGSLSLGEARVMIKRIAANYARFKV
ncbi:MAG: hypothetical protein JXP73_11515 [Deltaproteobacteria bacterium]|nr:hypothetical protein [Deltaproteobacteria bacterium]